jgi:hypothetical protein
MQYGDWIALTGLIFTIILLLVIIFQTRHSELQDNTAEAKRIGEVCQKIADIGRSFEDLTKRMTDSVDAAHRRMDTIDARINNHIDNHLKFGLQSIEDNKG